MLCIQVYGYDEIIINASESMNKVFTLCEQYYLCITIFSPMKNIWPHTKNCHLIYISHHFSTIGNCYFLMWFLIHYFF